MELHSYAKRRTTPKKWTIEQKRKLVENRIAYEKLFAQKPRGSVLPWKKVLSLANLDDYNVYFVRKQWANMVAKYKQYKINRLGNIPTQAIDDEMIHTISAEWEFFAPIHDYMMCKTRNLHSYAMQHDQEPNLDGNSNSNSSYECINIYSSDTNDIGESLECVTTQNTDHDFYSKKREENQQNNLSNSYFGDASEDTQESSLMMEIKIENETISSTQPQQLGLANEITVTSTQQQKTVPMEVLDSQLITDDSKNTLESDDVKKVHTCKKQKILSERDRYYKHKRRFNRRFERRFDAFLQVMGQVVKAEYPTINVSPLMRVVNDAKDLGVNLTGHIFSSDDEFDSESKDENVGKQENESH